MISIRSLLKEAIRKLKKRLIPFKIRRVCLFGCPKDQVEPGTLILFPYQPNLLACGLTGIIEFKRRKEDDTTYRGKDLHPLLEKAKRFNLRNIIKSSSLDTKYYLGGRTNIEKMVEFVQKLKRFQHFQQIFYNEEERKELLKIHQELASFIKDEEEILETEAIRFKTGLLEEINTRLVTLLDVSWAIEREILENIEKIKDLSNTVTPKDLPIGALKEFKKLNFILNNLDRLEIRGRDSSGFSTMVVFRERKDLDNFRERLRAAGLEEEFKNRMNIKDLLCGSIELGDRTVTFIFKTASIIGRLGENVEKLKRFVKEDKIFQLILRQELESCTTVSHTRWASVGIISEENCHPVDNDRKETGNIFVVLNGDIDNYTTLRNTYESSFGKISKRITTDTKIIPLQIERHLLEGKGLEEAFRLAVNSFEGSHAICMHSDLLPDKVFLALRGSGQAIYIGVSEDGYIPSSEVYGFVEETPYFLKMERDQICVLNERASDKLDGVKVYQYNGTEVKLVKDHIKRAEITTRDIDRRDFLHFFMKEVSESPRSVLKTFRGKMGIIKSDGARKAIISLDERVIPTKIVQALRDGKIKHIFTVGQGTAAVAAQGVANILHDYISSKVSVSAEKASELSGFHLRQDLSDTLVIAISQSGTTTDTNKAVDLARKRGAFTMAIVNRRGSDITYKVDGVFYTSDGRDIEMSVASTKAFYSQIIAGNLIALRFSQILGTCSEEFIINEMRDIRRLPGLMEQVLEKKEEIAKCAREYALSKRHWAVVGSGPNKVASDEIRIKLSELCYKTISTDTVEDKKHIDLSSEPLIIVCAGGVNDVVLSDIVKDVAIFKAHHATSIVITSDEEKEFKGYAASIISIPHANERLAPILNTIAGHIFGYYAALSIDEEARFFSKAKADITKKITRFLEQGLSLYDIISHRDFNAIINRLYIQFQEKKRRNRFAAASEVNTISTLTLLFKYALGRIPLRDFSEDFGVEGTLQNFLDILVQTLDKAINELSRPIDAIRHQAKTVTVGTSRKVKEVSGPLFDELREMGIRLDEIQSRNLTSLKRIQRAIFRVSGSTLYEISNLDTEGMPKSNSKIEVLLKRGISCDMNSRAERDKTLKGTKKSIVRSGDVFVGVGKLDRKHIVIVPVVSGGWVRRLALLHVEFNEELSLRDKIVALGEKYDNIVDDVTEYEIKWCDDYLDRFSTSELFTQSEESIVNTIIQGN